MYTFIAPYNLDEIEFSACNPATDIYTEISLYNSSFDEMMSCYWECNADCAVNSSWTVWVPVVKYSFINPSLNYFGFYNDYVELIPGEVYYLGITAYADISPGTFGESKMCFS